MNEDAITWTQVSYVGTIVVMLLMMKKIAARINALEKDDNDDNTG